MLTFQSPPLYYQSDNLCLPGGRQSCSIVAWFFWLHAVLWNLKCVSIRMRMWLWVKSCTCCYPPASPPIPSPPPSLPRLHSDIKSKVPLPATKSNSNFASKYDIASQYSGTAVSIAKMCYRNKTKIFWQECKIAKLWTHWSRKYKS